MKDISRKTEQFTDSVIRRMTRISLACGAINLPRAIRISTRPRPLPTGWPR